LANGVTAETLNTDTTPAQILPILWRDDGRWAVGDLNPHQIPKPLTCWFVNLGRDGGGFNSVSEGELVP
jgi:hypothetical protein